MSKMFTYNGKVMKTWNIFSGCKFDCKYCWAKSLITTRMKDTAKYKDCLFNPTFHEDTLKKTFNSFKPDEFVFVAPMGDIAFCPIGSMFAIFAVVKGFPQTKFLFCTKNPSIYDKFPVLDNIYYGCTIETNRSTTDYSKAPITIARQIDMTKLKKHNKFISIEPVMDFDLNIFKTWIAEINPKIVEIGADNYGHNLPEPSGEKVESLISFMETIGITVVRKQGLDRLTGVKNGTNIT